MPTTVQDAWYHAEEAKARARIPSARMPGAGPPERSAREAGRRAAECGEPLALITVPVGVVHRQMVRLQPGREMFEEHIFASHLGAPDVVPAAWVPSGVVAQLIRQGVIVAAVAWSETAHCGYCGAPRGGGHNLTYPHPGLELAEDPLPPKRHDGSYRRG